MRKITSLVAALLLSVATFAQAPQGFSYQAVVRDAQNTIVANQTVEVTISILQGATADAAKSVFSEKHSAKTNANGLFTITIGSVDAAGFAKIDWGKGSCFLKTESAYGESTTQLMSVPYALYAANAGTIDNTTIEQFVSNIDFTTYNLVNKSSLANYATTENVNNALANYTTEQKLKDTLAVYAKTADLPTVPTNLGDFTNNVGYLVASDNTGKANKGEMSIVDGETAGTAVITLQNNISETVLTADYIQTLQQQITDLRAAMPKVATVNVTVNYDAGDSDMAYIWMFGEKITGTKTFKAPLGYALLWEFVFGTKDCSDRPYTYCSVKVDGVSVYNKAREYSDNYYNFVPTYKSYIKRNTENQPYSIVIDEETVNIVITVHAVNQSN